MLHRLFEPIQQIAIQHEIRLDPWLQIMDIAASIVINPPTSYSLNILIGYNISNTQTNNVIYNI